MTMPRFALFRSRTVRALGAGCLALVGAVTAASAQDGSVARPFGTLREQAAMQQQWLEEAARHVPAGADAQARHRHVGRADARVQRGSGVSRRSSRRRRSLPGAGPSTCSSTSARRRRAAPAAACVERDRARRHIAGRGVRRAPLRPKPVSAAVGRGQQAELWGDEQWQALKTGRRGAEAAGHRHRPFDDVRVLATGCRAAS